MRRTTTQLANLRRKIGEVRHHWEIEAKTAEGRLDYCRAISGHHRDGGSFARGVGKQDLRISIRVAIVPRHGVDKVTLSGIERIISPIVEVGRGRGATINGRLAGYGHGEVPVSVLTAGRIGD